jgi:hypothetical protein
VVNLLTDWTLPPSTSGRTSPIGRMASTKARAFADFVAAGAAQPALIDPPEA